MDTKLLLEQNTNEENNTQFPYQVRIIDETAAAQNEQGSVILAGSLIEAQMKGEAQAAALGCELSYGSNVKPPVLTIQKFVNDMSEILQDRQFSKDFYKDFQSYIDRELKADLAKDNTEVLVKSNSTGTNLTVLVICSKEWFTILDIGLYCSYAKANYGKFARLSLYWTPLLKEELNLNSQNCMNLDFAELLRFSVKKIQDAKALKELGQVLDLIQAYQWMEAHGVTRDELLLYSKKITSSCSALGMDNQKLSETDMVKSFEATIAKVMDDSTLQLKNNPADIKEALDWCRKHNP